MMPLVSRHRRVSHRRVVCSSHSTAVPAGHLHQTDEWRFVSPDGDALHLSPAIVTADELAGVNALRSSLLFLDSEPLGAR